MNSFNSGDHQFMIENVYGHFTKNSQSIIMIFDVPHTEELHIELIPFERKDVKLIINDASKELEKGIKTETWVEFVHPKFLKDGGRLRIHFRQEYNLKTLQEFIKLNRHNIKFEMEIIQSELEFDALEEEAVNE